MALKKKVLRRHLLKTLICSIPKHIDEYRSQCLPPNRFCIFPIKGVSPRRNWTYNPSQSKCRAWTNLSEHETARPLCRCFLWNSRSLRFYGQYLTELFGQDVLILGYGL